MSQSVRRALDLLAQLAFGPASLDELSRDAPVHKTTVMRLLHSLGEKGFVTQVLERHGAPDHVVGCGPEPMLHALAGLAARWQVPCDVSLETPMACGVGICFSCVTKVKTPDGWDYKRVCIDGPVFDAAGLDW